MGILMGRLALQDIHLQLEYSMRRVNPATTKFDVAVEVVEVARFHAHEVSIVIVYNLALAYIIPGAIGMGEGCSCCGRRTRGFFVWWPRLCAAYCTSNSSFVRESMEMSPSFEWNYPQ